jgi:quinol monooxygenase YgiN
MEKLVMSVYPHQTKRKEMLSAGHMISSQTLEETGCMDCRVFPGRGEESVIHLEQYWRTRHQLDEYFRSDHFTALLGAMKLLAIKYELTINDSSPTEGIHWVNRARNTK